MMPESREAESVPELDENGVDLSVIRANLRLSPIERLRQAELRMQQARIDFRYTLTQREVAIVIRLLRRSPRWQVFFAWGAVALLFVAVGSVGVIQFLDVHDAIDIARGCGFVFIACLIPVVVVVTPGLSARFEARKLAKSQPDFFGETQVVIDANSIQSILRTSETKWNWEAVSAIGRERKLIFIMVGRRSALILPERVIDEAGQSSEQVFEQLQISRRNAPAFEPHCPQCGFDLRGGKIDGCPECGWRRNASR